jgi:GxxExxY protein
MIHRRGAEEAELAASKIRELPEETNRVTGDIISAAIEVHRLLGPGLLESVYERAMALELGLRSMQFIRQLQVPTYYKDELVGESRFDLLVANHVVVELKSIAEITDLHKKQVLAYLRAGGFEIGLLINFNVLRLVDGVRRIIATY